MTRCQVHAASCVSPVSDLPGVGEAEHALEAEGGQEVEKNKRLVIQGAVNLMFLQLWRGGKVRGREGGR